MIKSESDQIDELAKALATAQGQITGAKADTSNPFFKSKYADLESVWSVIRKPLSENGLCITQTVESDHKALQSHEGTTWTLVHYLVTTLMHSSGQWVSSKIPLLTKDNSVQAFGSAMTYARRYGIAGIVGVYQTDDDGENAMNRPTSVVKSQTMNVPSTPPVKNYAPTKQVTPS